MKGMKAFALVNPRTLQQASQALGNNAQQAKLMAGGIDLLTEMQDHLIEPDRVVNLKAVPGLTEIAVSDRGLTLGALVTLTAIERHPQIRRDYTALAEAAESVASPQIRNVGTIGGNLCQRPRCLYYRDETIICFKKGGTRCYAVEEEAANKRNAILGGGPSFIVHPSDCAPALVALNAVIRYGTGAGRPKEVSAEEFFILPNQPNGLRVENILKPNEIVQEIFIPRPKRGTRSTYLKFKERESFDWASSAVAAVAVTSGDMVQEIRIVLGGVAPKPWRAGDAEQALAGKAFSREAANAAAEAALAPAKPLSQNAFKVPLTKVLVRRAVEIVSTGKAPVTPAV